MRGAVPRCEVKEGASLNDEPAEQAKSVRGAVPRCEVKEGASLNDEPAEQAKSVRGAEDVTVKVAYLSPRLW